MITAIEQFDKTFLKYIPTIMHQANNGVIITDPNQKDNPIIYVNNITCQKFGYKHSEFIGKNARFLHHKDTNQKELLAIKDAIKNQRSITTIVKNYTKDGQLIYNQVTISPIYDHNKKLKYFLGLQNDVTNEKNLQEQNQIIQAQEIDNAKFNAIGKLSAGISHEINTPLAIIKGNLELLKNSIDNLEDNIVDKGIMIEDISTIFAQLKRLENVADSFREISDTNVAHKEKINLYSTLIYALRFIFNRAKNITKITIQNDIFDLDIDREKYNYSIFANRQKLEQVWLIILTNALDELEHYKDYNERQLTIKIDETKNTYILRFMDNAMGIDINILNNIFKPLHSTKESKGLGIGLSIAKKIIDEHGYKINAYNHNNHAVFEIIIIK